LSGAQPPGNDQAKEFLSRELFNESVGDDGHAVLAVKRFQLQRGGEDLRALFLQAHAGYVVFEVFHGLRHKDGNLFFP
jgi:hypothetical protein